MGNYTGTKTETFAILAKAASTLTIDPIAIQNFTGAAISPSVVVKDGNTTLTLGTDYSMVYSNNTNVGTATVTITGMGNYTGTKSETFSIISKAASTLTIDAIANQTFTGVAITPLIVVKDGNTTIALGSDYTVAFTSNTNVGTATVTITGMGVYTGTKTQTFAIVSKAASTLSIDTIANQTFTGAAITPLVVVKDGNTTLFLGTDYTVAYTSNTNVGTATVTITGVGNYAGTRTQTFTIIAKAASTLSIDVIANQTYTGSAITPTVVVKDGNTNLTLGTDYTVAYTSNTNVGTATVIITGIGNYTGTKTQTFTIIAKAASTLSIDTIANQTFTGAAITPLVVVKDGNTTLFLGTDYTVAHTSNTNVGTATVTITGVGNYTGTKTQTFTIVAKAASTLSIDVITNQTYTGSAITPTVVLKDGNTNLTLGTDYTVAYTSNTNVGTATVIITGIGNYTGTQTQTFAIVAKATSTLGIDSIANQTYTGSAITPTVVVKDGNTNLTLGTDYMVAYTNNTNAGTASVTITGTGNYSGDNPQTFTIAPKAVTIRANNASKIYGDANPSLSFSYSGLVAGDIEINQVPSISTTATPTSGVGTYRIQLSGGTDPNYSITRIEGALEVNPAPLSLAVTPATKIYGQADPRFAYRLQGLKGIDTDAVLRGILTREVGEDPGTYQISQGTLSAGSNYTLTVTGSTLAISKARALSVVEMAELTTDWAKEATLPATVNVLATHGQYFRVEVKWEKSSLNLLARGAYSLTGTLILPVGIENPDQVLAKIQVQVLPKPAPLDLTLTKSSIVGSSTTYFISVGDFVVNDPVDKIHTVSLLGPGYDNSYFEIKDNSLFWSSADPAAGKTTFSIVVRVTDRDGNTLDKFFEIKRTRPDASSLILTNTFSPNGDGANDTWGVNDLRFYQGVRISVYDRGGTRLFFTEKPDERWDGTHEGKQLPNGTFFWTIEIGETGDTRKGMLNLIRK
jgi:gliding motility-associated-like protein